MSVKAPGRLYLTADRERVVEEGDAEAAILFAAEGDDVSDEDAKRYGIKAKAEPKETKAESGPPENKAEVEAPEDKSEQPRARRGG